MGIQNYQYSELEILKFKILSYDVPSGNDIQSCIKIEWFTDFGNII